MSKRRSARPGALFRCGEAEIGRDDTQRVDEAPSYAIEVVSPAERCYAGFHLSAFSGGMHLATLASSIRVNYDTWTTGFNLAASVAMREAAGLTNPRIFRSETDDNEIVIIFDVADEAKARSWYASNELQQIMQRSGVTNLKYGFLTPSKG